MWRDAEDRTVAAVAWAIGLAGLLIGIIAAALHDGAVVDYGLKGLGGVLLLLTAYFTARSLRQAALAGFLERFMRASELLAEHDPVRQGAGLQALFRLHDYARDHAEKEAIVTVVREFGASEHPTDQQLRAQAFVRGVSPRPSDAATE
ncbi:MAG TPA: hypothetical protein VNZ01_00085 [Solirubrobacteraceae bacterium]|nr:hypothetical protein [Solirubrobacteraceae bacterium]